MALLLPVWGAVAIPLAFVLSSAVEATLLTMIAGRRAAILGRPDLAD